MDLLAQDMNPVEAVSVPVLEPNVAERDELAARRSLRAQVAKLERELADAFVTAFSMGGLPDQIRETRRDPRVLDLGELERVRDELAERLRSARVTISRRAEIQEANRLYLERMLLDPAEHRFARISREDLGEPGCGVWQVRPKLGLIGMLMGWWQVKLSSGCPLPMAARGVRAAGMKPSRSRRTSDSRH